MICAWCRLDTSDQSELFVASIEFNNEGLIQFFHLGKFLNVPPAISIMESQAKKSGKEFVFAFCSMDCGDRLVEARCKDSTLKWSSFRKKVHRRKCHKKQK